MNAMAIRVSEFTGNVVSEGFDSVEIIDYDPECQEALWTGDTLFRGVAVSQVSWQNRKTRHGEICPPEWEESLPASVREDLSSFVASPKVW